MCFQIQPQCLTTIYFDIDLKIPAPRGRFTSDPEQKQLCGLSSVSARWNKKSHQERQASPWSLPDADWDKHTYEGTHT